MPFCMLNNKYDSEVIVGIGCYLLMVIVLDRASFCCGKISLMYKLNLLVILWGHTYIVCFSISHLAVD